MCVYAGAVLVMIFAANVGAVHQLQRGRLQVSGSSPGTDMSEPVAAAVLGAEGSRRPSASEFLEHAWVRAASKESVSVHEWLVPDREGAEADHEAGADGG